MLRHIQGLMVLIFLLNSCSSSSPENHTSGEVLSSDTSSYYVPESGSTATIERKARLDTIEINDMKFQPDELKVHKGDTVIWINHDLVAHCVTEETNKAWTSSPIPGGASWKMVVTEGASYYCAIHQVMKGRIVIQSDQLSELP